MQVECTRCGAARYTTADRDGCPECGHAYINPLGDSVDNYRATQIEAAMKQITSGIAQLTHELEHTREERDRARQRSAALEVQIKAGGDR